MLIQKQNDFYFLKNKIPGGGFNVGEQPPPTKTSFKIMIRAFF